MDANEDRKWAWEDYRSRAKMFCAGLLLLPASFLGMFVFNGISGLFVISGVLGYALTVPLVFWNCPACGKRYFRRWWAFDNDYRTMFNPFRKACAHCGLTKWQEPVLSPEVRYQKEFPINGRKIARRKTQETFLRVVLRDDPRAVGLKPDEHGWFCVEDLLHRAKRYRINLRRDELDEILSEDRGCRFESGGGGELIRYKRGN